MPIISTWGRIRVQRNGSRVTLRCSGNSERGRNLANARESVRQRFSRKETVSGGEKSPGGVYELWQRHAYCCENKTQSFPLCLTRRHIKARKIRAISSNDTSSGRRRGKHKATTIISTLQQDEGGGETSPFVAVQAKQGRTLRATSDGLQLPGRTNQWMRGRSPQNVPLPLMTLSRLNATKAHDDTQHPSESKQPFEENSLRGQTGKRRTLSQKCTPSIVTQRHVRHMRSTQHPQP